MLLVKTHIFPKQEERLNGRDVRQEEGGRMIKGKKVGRGWKRRGKQGRGSEEEKRQKRADGEEAE